MPFELDIRTSQGPDWALTLGRKYGSKDKTYHVGQVEVVATRIVEHF
jgi:hypothetical protein